jgi:hypothetical protein
MSSWLIRLARLRVKGGDVVSSYSSECLGFDAENKEDCC